MSLITHKAFLKGIKKLLNKDASDETLTIQIIKSKIKFPFRCHIYYYDKVGYRVCLAISALLKNLSK